MQLCFLWVGMLAAKFNFQLSARIFILQVITASSAVFALAQKETGKTEKKP